MGPRFDGLAMGPSYLNLRIDSKLITNVFLSHVSIAQELNQHWWCHLEFQHSREQRPGGLLPDVLAMGGIDPESMVQVEEWLGKDLEVNAINQDGSETPIFQGFVFEVELTYEITGNYTASIQGVTTSYKSDVTRRHAYYKEKTLSDIAQQIADRTELDIDVNCEDGRPLSYVQWGETDFEFLHRIVDDHGAWMRPTETGIEVYANFQDGTEVRWRGESGEKGLLGFTVKGTLAPPSFNGVHYDHHEMKSHTFAEVRDDPQFYDSMSPLVSAAQQGSKDNLPPGYLHDRNRAVTLDEYEKLLKKESVRSMGASVTAFGQSRNTELLPGNTVQVDEALEATGTYGVTHVAHNWDPSGYTNQFTCTPWKNYTDPNPPQMKPWFGAVPARVTDHNDPKKMGRIQVQYFWQEDGPTHWARMVTPHAGADRGFMFMPEVGDEVLVAFEDGDPERPYVMGCLWNGVYQAPRADEFWGGDIEPNDVKRIVTKSGHRIQLVDKEGKESIVIATPKELKISLIENTDETGRSMITLHTENGDMFFSAPNGRIHFHSKFFSREVG